MTALRRRLLLPSFVLVLGVVLASCGFGQLRPTTDITAESATLRGVVANTEPGEVTYWFEYTITTRAGIHRTEPRTIEVTGATPVEAHVENLMPGQTYYVQLCVDDADGNGSCSETGAFTTLSGGAVGVDDLAGSFSGTAVTRAAYEGCELVHFDVDATYSGSPDVGQVTFGLEGCVRQSGSGTSASGTFTIETSSGSMSGTAVGTGGWISTFTLTPTSGTGAFAGVTTPLEVTDLVMTDPGSSGTIRIP